MISALYQRLRSSPTGMTAFAGYAAMLSMLVVGLVQVRLALHFLSDEEFGLWNVLGQTLGYLLLLDFGVSWSASRMLAGPVKSGDTAELNSWWTVIVAVLAGQGLLVAGIGLAATGYVIDFFQVSPEMVPSARLLWIGMILINAIQLPYRAYSGILYCQDRWYVMHFVSILSSWVNFLAFAGFLLAGSRTSAYLIASVLSIACSSAMMQYNVKRSGLRLRLSPRSFDMEKLRSLFKYSSGIFILAIATMITFMTQSVIVGKVLGLGAVPAFAVSSRSYTVIIQLVKRAFDSYNPRWMGLFVSDQRGIVWDEWRKLMSWLLPVAMIGVFGILIFNRSFSTWLGKGASYHVGREFDLLLAVGLVSQIFIYFTCFVFPMAAKVKGWCLAGLGDAAVQLVAGIVFTRWYGTCGVLMGDLLGPCLISIPFLLLKAPAELSVSRWAMLAVVLRTYGVAIVGLLACYFILRSGDANPAGWFPNGIEIFLGICLAGFGAFCFFKFRNVVIGVKQAEV